MNRKLTDNQEAVYNYLNKYPDWVRPTDIGYAVFGLYYNSSKASAICKSLVKKGLVKRNPWGHYKALGRQQ